MRSVIPESKQAAKDIVSRSYDIQITVPYVGSVLIQQLSGTIELYLSSAAEHIVIAIATKTKSAKFHFPCENQ